MNWWKQFKPKACSVNVKATSKDDALIELVENLVKAAVLDESLKVIAAQALREREELATTGLGMGVAIPHVKVPGLERTACALSVHKEGLDWLSLDGEPVHVLVTVLRPMESSSEHDPEDHLEMMSWLAKLARDPDFRRFARGAKTKTDLVDLLKEMSAV